MMAYHRRYTQPLLFAGLTAVFVGYLSVWLPGPAAGLRFLGIELGEWVKFMGVGPQRDLFYLPPITLGLMLALLTLAWPNGRWQTWAMRGLAVAVSLLVFPALEDIMGPFRDQYVLRVQLIGLVTLMAVLSGVFSQKWPGLGRWLPWLLLALLGLAGAVLPTWMYLVVRPAVSQVVGLPVGIGLGVWLNGMGHSLVAAVSLWQLSTVWSAQQAGKLAAARLRR